VRVSPIIFKFKYLAGVPAIVNGWGFEGTKNLSEIHLHRSQFGNLVNALCNCLLSNVKNVLIWVVLPLKMLLVWPWSKSGRLLSQRYQRYSCLMKSFCWTSPRFKFKVDCWTAFEWFSSLILFLFLRPHSRLISISDDNRINVCSTDQLTRLINVHLVYQLRSELAWISGVGESSNLRHRWGKCLFVVVGPSLWSVYLCVCIRVHMCVLISTEREWDKWRWLAN